MTPEYLHSISTDVDSIDTNEILFRLAVAASQNAEAIAKIADAIAANAVTKQSRLDTQISIEICNLPPFE